MKNVSEKEKNIDRNRRKKSESGGEVGANCTFGTKILL